MRILVLSDLHANLAVLFRKTGREKEAGALEKRAAAIQAIER